MSVHFQAPNPEPHRGRAFEREVERMRDARRKRAARAAARQRRGRDRRRKPLA